ncbi:50S ribosome-binding GTPase [Comamonas sp. Y33R10-2]|uniref:GTPase n=1 Tax=Comamonas sp. Y33R10-2 TaxID=2853257 RepID=UPI001C5CC1A8|nr:GTPase [Comamonas sp. Y33R10-2]QXZ10699.1 50S ribosome-binding GTPase [Comamonas sp. Y33R10-2]
MEAVIQKEVDEIKRKIEEESNVKVSVALFGQPGAGKSSLINAIAGKKLAETGVETDKTIKEHVFSINGLNFVDLPGYGTEKFPKQGYFDKFDLLEKDIFLCVTSGKLHADDIDLFKELHKNKKTCIFVFNKSDDLWEDGYSEEELKKRKKDDISKNIGLEVDVIFTSCRNKTGLNELQDKIASCLGAAKKDRWHKSAAAYSEDFLNKKFTVCKKNVVIAAGLSAANALNPIPGTDIALDISILVKLFKEIRESYGIDGLKQDDILDKAKNVAPAVNRVISYAAKEGVVLLIKNYAGRQLAKQMTKYIPFVGQAIAASLGFAITNYAGRSYLDDCHSVAKEYFAKNLK